MHRFPSGTTIPEGLKKAKEFGRFQAHYTAHGLEVTEKTHYYKVTGTAMHLSIRKKNHLIDGNPFTIS